MASTRPAEVTERSRELYRYFSPSAYLLDSPTDPATSPNLVLTSQAQLVTLKLNASRCTISFIDYDKQYTVAEATKTLHLDDTSVADDEDDRLWIGCGARLSKGSICYHTLCARRSEADMPAYFEVLDLSRDERFAHLPNVVDWPHVRYYYGAPLRSKRGLTIGSLTVFDTRPRAPMSASERNFLDAMADSVMLHMELMRESTERRRATNMNKSLNSFIDSEKAMINTKTWSIPTAKGAVTNARGSSADASDGKTYEADVRNNDASGKRSPATKQPPAKPPQVLGPSVSSNGIDPASQLSKNSGKLDFKQAAMVLRKSLEVQEGGGVVFFDTAPSLRLAGGDCNPVNVDPAERPALKSYPTQSNGKDANENLADVLAASISSGRTFCSSDAIQHEGFSQMPIKHIQYLLERYPRGKLWVLNQDGRLNHVAEPETMCDYHEPQVGIGDVQNEASLFRKYFPGACQVVSVPCWNAQTSRWCVCIAYSTCQYRTFTLETELLFCMAFCNCITIEMARLATLAADSQKGDFISSISHELRSPLHGILASCEFLQDTTTTSFQRSLVDAVNSCAKTLEDVLTQVLDYAKVNAFERNWQKASKKQGNSVKLLIAKDEHGVPLADVPPLLNIYGHVDLAAITEEVVEGVTRGQAYQTLTSGNITDLGAKTRGRTSQRGTSDRDMPASLGFQDGDYVEVILDITEANLSYITQPGALRRVIMNLVGNALKYTKRGWVVVKLEVVQRNIANPAVQSDGVHQVPGEPATDVTDMVRISVTDTGKGIDPDYLRTNLYKAFSQEDVLSSGTGLGLSLVKSILNMLNGTIEVKSTVGVGSQFTVDLPLMRRRDMVSTPSTATPLTGSTDTDRDDYVSNLRQTAQGCRIALFETSDRGEDDELKKQIRQHMHKSISTYVQLWYGLSLLPSLHSILDSDIILVDDKDLPQLLGQIPGGIKAKARPSILVLCSSVSRQSSFEELTAAGRVELLAKPFGPYSLARSIALCLDRPHDARPADDGLSEPFSPGEHEQPAHAFAVGIEQTLSVMSLNGILGNTDNPNAHKALESPTSNSELSAATAITVGSEPAEFPFPSVATASISDQSITPTLTRNARDNSHCTSPPSAQPLTRKNLHLVSTHPHNNLTAYRSRDSSASRTPVQTPFDAPNGATPVRPPPVPLAQIVPPSTQPVILIVDDNAINLRLLHTYLERKSYTSVLQAADGAIAHSLFAAQWPPPDIVFMDLSMPVCNGFEATRRIRATEAARAGVLSPTERSPPALIIALTGLASARDQAEAFDAGVDLYMTKPVSFKDVQRLLTNWTKNGGREAEGVPSGSATSVTTLPDVMSLDSKLAGL